MGAESVCESRLLVLQRIKIVRVADVSSVHVLVYCMHICLSNLYLPLSILNLHGVCVFTSQYMNLYLRLTPTSTLHILI